MKFLILIIATIISIVKSATTYQDDYVPEMPGWGKHSYKLYSGMLDADEKGTRQLHYFFIESQRNPQNDDLVVWLNGGPGCSSLLGMIQEIGPYQFEGLDDFLTNKEEFSWNKIANLLFIESPAGVGFSKNPKIWTYEYSDPHTAQDLLYAYNQFLTRFANSDLNLQGKKTWLSGESYGGMYIPYFANEILDFNEQQDNQKNEINLQGFLVGNGAMVLDWVFLAKYQMNTYIQNQFLNQEYAQDFNEGCLSDVDNSEAEQKCTRFLEKYMNINNNTDVYQIYNYTYSYNLKGDDKFYQHEQDKQLFMHLFEQQGEEAKMNRVLKDYYQQIYNALKKEEEMDQEQESKFDTPNLIIKRYFNSPEVKQAMHVPDKRWALCNLVVRLRYKSAKNSSHLYPRFVQKGLRMLLFSGNVDAAVPWPYTYYCLDDLMKNYDTTLKINDKWRQWNKLENQQVGGMVQNWNSDQYNGTLTYAMVRAAGHEVPEYQPYEAFYLFEQFITGQDI